MKIKISRRWVIFVISCSLFVLSQFYRSSVAVIAQDLIKDTGLDTKGLSLVSAAFFYAFAIMQIPIGFYLDSIGPRITMTVLTLVAVAGSLIFAFGDSLAMLVTGRVLLGVGMSCNFMGLLKLITLWFGPVRFATLAALVTSIGTLGNIAAATPLVLMVNAVGWRMTFAAFGALNFLIAVIFFIVVKDRPEVPVYGQIPKKVSPDLNETLKSIKALFAEKDYWIISFGTFCRYGIYAAVQALWAGPYLMKVMGISDVATGNILFLMSMGLVLGSPVCGYLSDITVHSRKKMIIAGISGMIAILMTLAYLPSGTGPFIPAILFFCFGFFSSAGQIMYAHIKERMPIERAGTAMTGINFFTMGGVAVFLQGLGNIMQRLYPDASLGPAAFKGAFFICAGCLAITVILYFFTIETLGDKSSRDIFGSA